MVYFSPLLRHWQKTTIAEVQLQIGPCIVLGIQAKLRQNSGKIQHPRQGTFVGKIIIIFYFRSSVIPKNSYSRVSLENALSQALSPSAL